jgi:hypothetical protein
MELIEFAEGFSKPSNDDDINGYPYPSIQYKTHKPPSAETVLTGIWGYSLV